MAVQVMSGKNHVLIISNKDSLPNSLSVAVDDMLLDTTICPPPQAFAALRNNKIQAAVLALERIEQLYSEDFQEITEQLKSLSIDALILAENVDQVNAGDENELLRANLNESSEMIKGRLATLFDLRPRFQHLNRQILQLQSVGQPLSDHIAQVDEEMRLAARLQRDFLPRQLPQLDNIKFATLYRPATWVSGDIYDIMRLDEHHIGFYVADVVGHGMPAALLTMFIKRALVAKQITGNSYTLIEPSKVLQQLNEDLVEQNLSNFQFATACYALLNTETLQLRLAGAGHPSPMCIDPHGQSRELQAKGSLLGIFPDRQYQTSEYQLHPGDKLLLFSDGVELAFVNDGPDQPLRFRQEFEYLAQCDVETMTSKLIEIIENEEGSLHPRDDVTIVGLEIS